ncbi:acetaldehyde dehydrogenase (acetylating) [Derxia lacustris]|uniref:acetaldehyde dehydrogenase (acetylating) n=1 Tax=Derxia lacustris TaxID=764842 RepID=UPI000A176949|nr:acetaldehyde dehydrogenase (acetylating) [Derxia lacustris]
MSKKIRCALIGSGNIGTDLIYKIRRSPLLEPVWMVGVDPQSEGLARARDLGLKTTADGIEGLLPHIEEDGIQIAFDATSAYVHAEHSRKLNALGVMVIDLTPAAIGPLCSPPVNLSEHAARVEMNVNMISCAGQATIPMVYAVSRVQSVDYAEIVASLSSRSVGPGTRKNLDEFTFTTSSALCKVGGARRGKAMAVVNPADPPVIMRNTVYCLTDDEPDQARIRDSVARMIADVQQYVPGYRLVNGPVFDGKRVSIYLEVAGLGDYLPRYAGNLDIMTAAATRTAEMFAEEILAGSIALKPVLAEAA